MHVHECMHVCLHFTSDLKSLMCVVCIIQSMIGVETTHRVRGYCLKSQKRLGFVNFVICN
jgi:hypothetical protein